MLVQSIVGCILVIIGMLFALGLVRWAANAVIVLIAITACAFVVLQIVDGQWTGWLEICSYALLSGGASTILSLPVLPFSSFRRKH